MAHAEDGFGPCDSKEVLHEEEQKTQAFPLEFLALTKDGGELHRYREGLGTEELQKPVKVFSGVDQAQWTADGQKVLFRFRKPNRILSLSADHYISSVCTPEVLLLAPTSRPHRLASLLLPSLGILPRLAAELSPRTSLLHSVYPS